MRGGWCHPSCKVLWLSRNDSPRRVAAGPPGTGHRWPPVLNSSCNFNALLSIYHSLCTASQMLAELTELTLVISLTDMSACHPAPPQPSRPCAASEQALVHKCSTPSAHLQVTTSHHDEAPSFMYPSNFTGTSPARSTHYNLRYSNGERGWDNCILWNKNWFRLKNNHWVIPSSEGEISSLRKNILAKLFNHMDRSSSSLKDYKPVLSDWSKQCFQNVSSNLSVQQWLCVWQGKEYGKPWAWGKLEPPQPTSEGNRDKTFRDTEQAGRPTP